jgi:hypothetical protein
MGTPTFVDSDSNDNDNDDDNDKDNDSNKENWPEPPSTPVYGDDMHPPAWPLHSGKHLGHGWEVNSWGTTHYYRFLIRNPITSYYIVAPYVTYSINREKPEISGTYGRGHLIMTHTLRPTQVDYICPVITLPQQCLLDVDAPYANAVNHIINNYFPYNLSTGVWQYQFYKEKEYQVQRHIKDLQHQEMHYLEKAVGLLSELENTNVLGCFLVYMEIIHSTICDTDPLAILPFKCVANTFASDITQSAIDTRVNVHHKTLKDHIEPNWHHLTNNIAITIQNEDEVKVKVIPSQVAECNLDTLSTIEHIHNGKTPICTNNDPEHRARVHHWVDSHSSNADNLFEIATQEIEDHLHRQFHNHPCKPLTMSHPWPIGQPKPHNCHTKCFHCRQCGHIHATCPCHH